MKDSILSEKSNKDTDNELSLKDYQTEERLAEVKDESETWLAAHRIRFNPDRAPIPADLTLYFPIDSQKRKEFFEKNHRNSTGFEQSYQNLLNQLNELCTEILAQSIVGGGEIKAESTHRNIELYTEGNEFILAMLGSESNRIDDFYHWLVDEATRPLAEPEDLKGGAKNLEGFFKEYQTELTILEQYLDSSASLIQKAAICWLLRRRGLISPYSSGTFTDALKRIFGSLGIVGETALGIYDPITAKIDVGVNLAEQRNFRIRAATKGVFLGAGIATGGAAIPLLICTVTAAAWADMSMHKQSTKLAKERGKHIAVHETVHQLGSSLAPNADTWVAKCGFTPYSNLKK